MRCPCLCGLWVAAGLGYGSKLIPGLDEFFTVSPRRGLFGLSEGFRQPRQRETRGSPALCVSGSFQGNQRVFGAPFCFSRVSLGKLASFPESESWSGAKSGAKLRKSARYPGIFQVYRGFPGIPAKYPVFCRFWPQNSLRHGSEPPQNDEFHGVSPGVSRGN